MSRIQVGELQTFPSVDWLLLNTLKTSNPEDLGRLMTCPMFVLWPEHSLSVTTLTREWAAWWCSSVSSWTTTSAATASQRRDAASARTGQSASTSMCQRLIHPSPWERTPACPASTLLARDQLAVRLGGSRSTPSQPSLTAATSMAVRTMWRGTWDQELVADWWRVTSSRDTCPPKNSCSKLQIILVLFMIPSHFIIYDHTHCHKFCFNIVFAATMHWTVIKLKCQFQISIFVPITLTGSKIGFR